MDMTIGYIACCQSPTLFVVALVLLVAHFLRKRHHRIRAVLDLVLCIICVVAGVALYFIGIGRGEFTIHDCFAVRTPGIVGVVIVAILSVVAAIRGTINGARRRKAERQAARESAESTVAVGNDAEGTDDNGIGSASTEDGEDVTT